MPLRNSLYYKELAFHSALALHRSAYCKRWRKMYTKINSREPRVCEVLPGNRAVGPSLILYNTRNYVFAVFSPG
jgi:hypothetical protein